MIKNYNVTVYEQYYESTYEVDNLQFSTEKEAKEFEKKIALTHMTDVMRFFRKRVPDNFILSSGLDCLYVDDDGRNVYREDSVDTIGDGEFNPISGGGTRQVKVLHGYLYDEDGLKPDLGLIDWHYDIRRGILRVSNDKVKIYEYNEETGQYYLIDSNGDVVFKSHKVNSKTDLNSEPHKITVSGNLINNVVWVEKEGTYYIFGQIVNPDTQAVTNDWRPATTEELAEFEDYFALTQDKDAINSIVTNNDENLPWWKQLIRKLWNLIKELGLKIKNLFQNLLDLLRGTAYIGYVIDFGWEPTSEDYSDWDTKTEEQKNAIKTSFREMYETAEALQLQICTKFLFSSNAVKHFNNIIDVMNNVRGYDFPTNDNKIINNWHGTQKNKMEEYYDGGYYVYDKVRGWITAVEAYNDGIL